MGTIRRRKNNSDNIIYRALLLGGISFAPCAAFGADHAAAPVASKPAISREALRKLGREFANTIGSRLQEADLYLNGAGKIELAEHKARTQIPDDEPLIMHATVNKGRVEIKQDIYAVKHGHKLFVSLGDFVTATDLAITVKTDDGTADGWFIREDQKFHLDVKKNEVTLLGKTEAVDPSDLQTEGDMILVSTETLEKWFGLNFDYNFSGLLLALTSNQPLPIEAAYNRTQKGSNKRYGEAVAKLPEQKVPYALLSQPYFDTTLSGGWVRPADGEPIRSGTWSTIINNDIAGFNAQTYASGPLNKEYPLSTARITLGRQDPDGNLLGPLHATSYQFGDIVPVPTPLIGSSALEQGVIVTNKPTNTTTETTTQITGNAQPGWDVELYRNDVYLDIRHVDVTGLYDFQSIDLVLGTNDLKLLFYGPHGEIHEEHRQIEVDPGLLAGHAGYYAASVTRNGLTTYQPDPPSGPGIGDPNIAATYEYGLGKSTTANIGVRRHTDQGEPRTFAQTGIATYLYGTYLNAETGVDAQTGASTAVMTARRNIGNQSALLQYAWTAEGYNTASPDAGSSVRDTYRAALSGPLPGRLLGFRNFNYSINGTQTNNYDGSQQYNLTSTLATRLSTLSFSGGLGYNKSISADGDTNETATADLNAHGFAYGGNWRIGTRYNVIPTSALTEASLQYDHPLGETMDTTAQVRYTPNPDFADASLALNWRTKKATISPTIALDTNDNLRAGVNVHFGSAADPFSHKYTMYNNYMTASGGVAARVFQDKNGNGIFDADDEVMPDVVVKALQVHRNGVTDARGIALLPDIAQNTLTDIVVDASSFKDSYGISLFDGVSLRTHPGSMTQLDFPVVMGGELDGQADIIAANGTRKAASNVKLSLIAPDGKVEKAATAAFDGYYAISSIRPGVYYLTADTGSDDENGGAFMPRLLEFKPDGTTLFGQGITLQPGYNTRFIYTSENKAPVGSKRARVVRLDDIESQRVYIRLGQYHSRLAMTFAWYKFKIRSKWGQYLALTKPLSEIKPDPKTQLMDIELIARKSMTMQAAADICQRLQDEKFQCSVKVVTKYRNTDPVVSARNGTSG